MAKKLVKNIDIKYIIYGVSAILILLIIILFAKSCSGSNKSPEKVVISLIENNVNGKSKKSQKCYLDSGENGSAQTEIDSSIKYYTAHGATGVTIVDSGVLSKNGDCSYVYVIYNLVLKNKQEYPCISTYMVMKSEKCYYVLPASEVTDEMSELAQKAYEEFIETKEYADYTKAYEIFMKKNPGYEEKLIEKIGE